MGLLVGPVAEAAWPSERADPRNTGALGPLTPGDGDVLWTKRVGGFAASPSLTEDRIIVVAAAIHAINASTGDEEWIHRPTFGNFTPRGWVWNTPVTDGEIVAFSTAYPSIHVASLEDGTEIWRDVTVNIPRSLVLSGDRLFAALDKNVTERNLSTGDEAWRSRLAAEISGLTVVEDTVFAATSGSAPEQSRVYALEGSTGQTIWNASLDAPATGMPAVGDNAVLVPSAPTDDGEAKAQAFDRRSGEVLWETRVPAPISHPLAVEEGTVFASYGAEDREGPTGILALSTSDGVERWSSESASGTIAVSEGIVFAGGDGVVGLLADDGDVVREFRGPHPASRVTVGDGILVATGGETLYGLDGGRAVEGTEDVPLAPIFAIVVTLGLTAHASTRRGGVGPPEA